MTTSVEYALMAGAAYISTRTTINRFPVPEGWAERVDLRIRNDSSGFEGIALQRGTEIVISYAGTYDKSGVDLAADAGLATGVGSQQLREAIEYYLQIRAANPSATITLTGHSLGGGLASLVGVFFGVSATTFDQAPFALTALSKAAELKTYLASKVDGSGNRIYSDEQLAPLTSYIAQKEAIGASPSLIPNAGLVTNINVQGEFLSTFGWNIFNRIGTSIEDIANNAPGVTADDLHSQALLAAFLQSRQTASSPEQALNKVTYKLSDLMKMVFDTKLFAHRTDEANDNDHKNLLEHLVRHQAGMGESLPADRMVERFTADLWKLAQEGGLTMNDGNAGNPALHQVSNALIAFAMQKYYEETSTSAGYNKELFSKVATGALRFDMADLSQKNREALDAHQALDLKAAKGFDQYFKNYLASSAFNDDERALINAMLPWMRDWYVQAGASGMEVSDTLNRGAFMLGGKESDVLTGGTSADLLIGNAGNDRLKGGKGRLDGNGWIDGIFLFPMLGRSDSAPRPGGTANDRNFAPERKTA